MIEALDKIANLAIASCTEKKNAERVPADLARLRDRGREIELEKRKLKSSALTDDLQCLREAIQLELEDE